jgi:4-diphosphocytidyl-2-C-methyl-D-erythritol kinase
LPRAQTNGTRVFAPAKINLFLHVGAKRADAFHTLESFVVFAETGDRLSFANAPTLTLLSEGLFAAALPTEDENIAMKAARALSADRGAAIVLEKNLPVASGLGGGSADAAAVLRGLNLLWELGKTDIELMEIGATLGSDVPVCVLSRPAFMEGRGERVTKAPPVPTLSMVLVNPNLKLSTVDVFARVTNRSGVGLKERPPTNMKTLWDVTAYLAGTRNDLELPAAALAPAIDKVLDALAAQQGCVLAQMSGSGATCFGLFESRQFALNAAEALAHAHKKWWVRATRIAEPDIGSPHWNNQ